MSTGTAPHHTGTYRTQSRYIRAFAYAHPDTRCWRCQRTLAEIRTTNPKAKWTAGHLIDGQVNGELAPECSPCNYSAGATAGNQRRNKPDVSRTW